jgi:hypothetical protein
VVKRALFIDPASVSTGWALVQEGVPLISGTAVANPKAYWGQRLADLASQYRDVAARLTNTGCGFSTAYFERIPNLCADEVWFSIGAIAAGLAPYCRPEFATSLVPTQWQKRVGWVAKEMKGATLRAVQETGRGLKPDSPLHAYKDDVKSIDELAALGLGLAYFQRAA